jgi:hypothetical protein
MPILTVIAGSIRPSLAGPAEIRLPLMEQKC